MIARETTEMIAGMSPELRDGEYVFGSVSDPSRAIECLPDALATFREREGWSLVLPMDRAAALGFACSEPMRLLTLNVYSALDGVGLTAAVASALARRLIPCNVIAAFHHDHVFVPTDRAAEALAVLVELSSSETKEREP